MQSSKSSTSIDEARREYIVGRVNAHDYLTLLMDLLAIIHRDGGQYTAIAGLAVSIEDAHTRYCNLLAESREARKRG